jgi:hypothetical protein
MQIDPFALEVFGFAEDSFLKKPEPAGDATTPMILCRTADLDPVQVVSAKAFRNDRAAGCSYDAFSFVRAIDPITDAGVRVALLDAVYSDNPTEHIFMPYSGGEADAGGVLGLAVEQKPARIIQRIRGRRPRKPSAQTLEVTPNRGE